MGNNIPSSFRFSSSSFNSADSSSNVSPRGDDDKGFSLNKRKDRSDEKTKDKESDAENTMQGGAAGKVDSAVAATAAKGAAGPQDVAAIKGVQAVQKIILQAADAIAMGKGSVVITLKTDASVPVAFQGGTMMVQSDANGTVIRFDNIKTDAAELLMKGNPQALQDLANTLVGKGLTNVQMQLGDKVTINLNPTTADSPMTVAATSHSHSFEREGGGQQGGGGQQQKRQDQGPKQ